MIWNEVGLEDDDFNFFVLVNSDDFEIILSGANCDCWRLWGLGRLGFLHRWGLIN